MDSKTNVPSFTVSLRGYDRMEVDEYLDSLAEALGQVEDGEEHNQRLQGHIGRLNGRIRELEDRIRSDTPKTGAIVGERIGIMLRSAEETAADTVQRAEVRAAELVTVAEQRVTDAEESSRVTVAGGQEQARRIEASARAEAAEIISEAEARASARTRQIEQWAEQVVSHTRAEEARMLHEQQEKRNAALAELAALRDQRDAVRATLSELRETLGQALGLVVPPEPTDSAESAEPEESPATVEPADSAESDEVGEPEPEPEPETDVTEPADEAPAEPAEPAESSEDTGAVALFDGEAEAAANVAAEEPVTGEIEVRNLSDAVDVDGDDDDFEAKLEAWVSDGAKHFRRM